MNIWKFPKAAQLRLISWLNHSPSVQAGQITISSQLPIVRSDVGAYRRTASTIADSNEVARKRAWIREQDAKQLAEVEHEILRGI
jgi:hypothetical protein